MSGASSASLAAARAVADAVLYEGYLLYPYRSTARKNQVRWQFGVLGPPGAADAGIGEQPDLAAECLVQPRPGAAVTVHLRFLQLQSRTVERAGPPADTFSPVDEMQVGGQTWLGWDEAVEQEIRLGPFELADPGHTSAPTTAAVAVPGGRDVEPLRDAGGGVAGRLVRRRRPLAGEVSLSAEHLDAGLLRLRIAVANTADPATGSDDAVRRSFVGANLLLEATDAAFVSLLDPPDTARAAAAQSRQHRCFPVLAGTPGQTGLVLVSPIILYDYPQVAEQSAGALFDATEIDEILTLRVLTMTEQEKASARATDPRAADLVDRCESLSPEALQAMHGVLRDPHAGTADAGATPWWDPAADASVSPDLDTVRIDGVQVGRDSVVRLHPRRRADAQDLFVDGREARVTGVFFDVDGEVHVAVVVSDDPAADLHDWYGRYLYFAPDEVEPLVRSHDSPTAAKEH